MAVFKCKMCGGDLIVEPGVKVAECEYCGTKQTLPNLDNEKKANLYDRANHFRRNNDFDKAMGIYEQILNEDQSDAEAYWSLVLCRYGIEYVEDPATHKRVPTVNRAQYTSIFADEDYKSALEHADPVQKGVYEAEAKAIDEIQKGILEISSKEEPFDVFICYKETDADGRRTQDSVLANDLYHQLTQEGFKVFFSRITLEDKLGTAYEPYIFAALNSAKVMVVIGTKPEYFNAVWVKNEWSRYLALIRSGAKKTLIPAYRDMDPYDLPEEFSHLQAQDMSKLGFMQDLIRGIKKISAADAPKAQETVVVQSAGNTNLTAQLKRGQMALEDRDWEAADDFFDKALDIDAESAEAFLGKALAANRCSNLDAFIARRLNRGADREETLTACEKNTGIVNEAVKKYQIPGYYEEGSIRKLFIFDKRTYSSLTSAWKDRISEEEEFWSTDKQLSRAVRFAKGDTASLLQSAKEKILTELKERLAASEQADRQTAAQISSTYADKMNQANQQAEEMYQKAVECRQRDYETACKKQEEADSVEAYRVAEKMFRQNGLFNFQDCAERAGQCEESIRLIQEKAAAEAKAAREKFEADAKAAAKRKKRNTLIALLCAAVVAAGALLTVFVILPAVNYGNAEKMLAAGDYDGAIAQFEALKDYKDSAERIQETQYAKAEELLFRENYDDAIAAFTSLGEYKDSKDRLLETQYAKGESLFRQGDYVGAASAFHAAGNYKDSKAQIEKCETAIMEEKYSAAVELYNAGKYEDAITAFTALNGYKESAAHIEKSETAIKEEKYTAAVEHYNGGKFVEAFTAFEALDGYKDSAEKLREIGHSSEWLKVAPVGTTVFFGSYEQDNITSNGKEEIEWIVLARVHDRILVTSRCALDCQQYNTSETSVTWETCTLRKWLNGTFLNTAFSESEIVMIPSMTVSTDNNPSYNTYPGSNTTDKIFLLSIQDANMYFSTNSARECQGTAYCFAQGAHQSGRRYCWWWLRSPGCYSYFAAGVSGDGSVEDAGHNVDDDYDAVRPAMWITVE